VPTSTGKLLELLDLLQSRPLATGREAAERLGVDRRTVRRYVAALQELGIPVEGDRGVGGGYRLRPGFRLPPLMLDDSEAAVVAVGLAAARRLGLGDAADVDAALAKIRRVLPAALRGRVEALDHVLGFTVTGDAAQVPGERLMALADAVHRRRRIRFSYRSRDGERTERDVSPHGLVVHGGRWYLAAYDHTRGEPRTFRADRLTGVSVQAAAAVAPPDGFDPIEHVRRSLARVPFKWEVEVLLDLPLEQARRRVPAMLAELTADGERTRLRMRVDSLDWTASVLAGLDCRFEIRRPEALRESVRALAERLAGWAVRPSPA
jgi:predicted DNA-binding transcriptional regulator YafY